MRAQKNYQSVCLEDMNLKMSSLLLDIGTAFNDDNAEEMLSLACNIFRARDRFRGRHRILSLTLGGGTSPRFEKFIKLLT